MRTVRPFNATAHARACMHARLAQAYPHPTAALPARNAPLAHRPARQGPACVTHVSKLISTALTESLRACAHACSGNEGAYLRFTKASLAGAEPTVRAFTKDDFAPHIAAADRGKAWRGVSLIGCIVVRRLLCCMLRCMLHIAWMLRCVLYVALYNANHSISVACCVVCCMHIAVHVCVGCCMWHVCGTSVARPCHRRSKAHRGSCRATVPPPRCAHAPHIGGVRMHRISAVCAGAVAAVCAGAVAAVCAGAVAAVCAGAGAGARPFGETTLH